MIDELERVVEIHNRDYSKFSSNFMAVRTAERDLEIIGEAIKKIFYLILNSKISSSKDIIGLRNMIVHAYDSIDPTTLWKIIIKDLPTLKKKLKIQRGESFSDPSN